MFLINLHGMPPTIVPGITSLTTTEPAAITACLPILQGPIIVQFDPIHAPFST